VTGNGAHAALVTFRTNFGLRRAGGSAPVPIMLRFSFPAGSRLQCVGTVSKDLDLVPNQFLLIHGLAASILGPDRESLGDLRGIGADSSSSPARSR
jgi:hypothetical protein